jgi:diaminopimelate epimerase
MNAALAKRWPVAPAPVLRWSPASSRNLLESPVRVSTRGGELNIAWAGEGTPVFMTGPAVTVFEADIHLE